MRPLPLPAALSPSRLSEFRNCPLSFQFSAINRLRGPKQHVQVAGIVAHRALERLYAAPPEERTEQRLLAELAAAMKECPVEEFEGDFDRIEDFVATDWPTRLTDMAMQVFGLEDPAVAEVLDVEHALDVVVEGVRVRGYIDRVVAENGEIWIEDWKGLALDTPLATPTGWTTMGEVEVGHSVLAPDGNPTLVIGKSGVKRRRCFRVTFDDGSSIVCDDEHLWTVQIQDGAAVKSTTISTQDLAHLTTDRKARRKQPPRIENTRPIQTTQKVPIDPYVLGVWLGDGRTARGSITVWEEDASHIIAEFDKRGFRLSGNCASGTCRELSFRTETGETLTNILRREGLLGDKHLPEAYTRANPEARLEVLRGLMDTDGHWNKRRKQADFSTTVEQIANAVADLVVGLGSRAYTWKLRNDGTTRQAWSVVFTPNGFNPFSLPRKGGNVRQGVARSTRRTITSVVEVASVPTQCIAVDNSESMYLAGRQMVPTHNTGKVPRLNTEHARMANMYLYAAMYHAATGQRPTGVRLIFISTNPPTVLEAEYTPTAERAVRLTLPAIWSSIETQCSNGVFTPRKGRLCDWCPHQRFCPAFGGDPRLAPLPEPK